MLLDASTEEIVDADKYELSVVMPAGYFDMDKTKVTIKGKVVTVTIPRITLPAREIPVEFK